MTWNPITNLGRALGGFGSAGKKWVGGLNDRPGEEEQRQGLMDQADRAGSFANVGEAGYGGLGLEGDQARQFLRDQATGKISLSGEQLRQGLQQQLGMQQSAAAGAPAGSQAMAARTAMTQGGRASSAMAGNAAIAGIQERTAAQKALMDAILGQRQQDMQVALGSRQNAIQGIGGITPGQSWMDSWGNAILGGASVAMGGRGRPQGGQR
jgi:hypothetical protein